MGGDINYMFDLDTFIVALGGGYKFGESSIPYLNLDVILGNDHSDFGHYWYANINAGKGLLSGGVGIAINL